MIHLTDDQRAELLARPDLSPREREVTGLRYRDGLGTHIIARRIGLSVSTVTSLLASARRRLSAPCACVEHSRVPPLSAALDDPGWWTRNADMVRSLAHDPDHQERYLRCLGMLFGDEVSEQIRARASA